MSGTRTWAWGNRVLSVAMCQWSRLTQLYATLDDHRCTTDYDRSIKGVKEKLNSNNILRADRRSWLNELILNDRRAWFPGSRNARRRREGVTPRNVCVIPYEGNLVCLQFTRSNTEGRCMLNDLRSARTS